MSTVVSDLLIVGGGCTGSLIASLLGTAVSKTCLWEKSASPGRLSSGTGRGAASGCTYDLGAQYFTAFDGASGEALAQAEAAGVLSVLPKNSIGGEREATALLSNYFAPNGSASLAAHYLAGAVSRGLQYEPKRRLARLGVENGLWQATDESGRESLFRACVLTLPPPQVLELGGEAFQAVLDASGAREALSRVTFSSRFALALHFEPGSLGYFDARLPGRPWLGRYISPQQAGGGVLRYLSFETRKRPPPGGAEAGGAAAGEAALCPTFLVHSSVEFGAAHAAATPEAEALLEAAALAALGESLQGQGGGGAGAASDAAAGAPALPALVGKRLHRWKFSQVLQGPPAGLAAEGALLLQGLPLGGALGASPPLILAGDGMAGRSNFSACYASAAAAVKHITQGLPLPA